MSGKEEEPLYQIKKGEELELDNLNKDGASEDASKDATSTRSRGNKKNSSGDGSVSSLTSPVRRGSSSTSSRWKEIANLKDFDIKETDNFQFHYAVSKPDILRKLLKQFKTKTSVQEALNQADIDGETPIHRAAAIANIESLEMLYEFDNSLMKLKTTKRKRSVLHLAVKSKAVVVVKFVISKDPALINTVDSMLQTPVHYAASLKQSSILETLISKGCDTTEIFSRDANGQLPIHIATSKGLRKNIELLLREHPGVVDELDNSDQSLILLAAKNDFPKVVLYLLAKNANCNLKDKSGLTAFDWAVKRSLPDVVKVFLDMDGWKEVVSKSYYGPEGCFGMMIQSMPSMAKMILDKCVTTTGTKDHPKVVYDFFCLESKDEKRSRPRFEALDLMAERICEICLRHPVAVKYVDMKWRKRGFKYTLGLILVTLVFHICLMIYTTQLIGDVNKSTASTRNGRRNVAMNIHTRDCTSPHAVDMKVLRVIILIIAIGGLLKAVLQMMVEGFHLHFYRLALFIVVMFYLLPVNQALTAKQLPYGAVAVFLSWINLMQFLKLVPVLGIYLILVQKIFWTVIKIFIVILVYLMSFASTFYVLLAEHDSFRNIYLSFVSTFVAMINGIDYYNLFVTTGWYPQTYEIKMVILVLFLLTMSIVVNNALIGLAVGDTNEVMKSASFDKFLRRPKQEKPKQDRIDHYRPQGEEFDKAYTYDYKARIDDTGISQQRVTSEKITVSRSDITRMEETEKPTYPKDIHVGRIVIEEIPEEKEVTKSDVVKRDEVKPRHEDKETRYEVENVPTTRVKEELVKVGRLDVTDYEKIQRESERVEQRKATYMERLRREQKPKEKADTQTIERRDIEDLSYSKHKPYDRKPRYDETRLYQKEIDGRTVAFRRDDEICKDSGVQREEYPEEKDVGRQETQEFDIPGDIYRKLLEKPRITEVATTQHEVEDITKSYKDDIRDIGRLDIRELEKRPLASKRVEQKTSVVTEKLKETEKTRKDERPKEDRIDHYRPQGEEFEKAYTYDVKSHTDDTEISQQRVTSEKITVSRRDITRMEETEKPTYPKDIDIGRIVIEEISEEKEELMKRDVVKRDQVKPKREDIETRYEVEKIPRKQVEEGVVNVGRLDITDYEKTPRESEQVQERTTTYTESFGMDRKPKRDERPKEDRIDHYRPQGEEFDKAYTYDYKSRTDHTEVSDQQVTSEKITVSRRDITRMEETEKPRYPKDLDIGRIVIEEIPEEKEEVTKRDVIKRDEVKPRREGMETRYQVERGPKRQLREEIIKVGKFDVRDYEKTAMAPERVEDKATTYTYRKQKDLKPKREKPYEDPKTKERYIDDTHDDQKLYERKPRYDETEVTRDRFGTEKVTITRTCEDERVDRIERQKYPKDKDVGRIGIDETVEETPKQVCHKIIDRPQKKETTSTRKDVTDIHRTDVKDVERTYIHKEKEPFGPTRPEEEFLPQTERLDHQRKVRKDETPDDTAFDRRVLEDLDSASRKEPKSYMDDTHAPRQRVTTERIIVSRHDITRTEDTEKPRYPKDLDIGRIVIEEIPEEKILKRESPQTERSKLTVRETIATKETKVPRKEVIDHKPIHKEYTTDYEERPWERRTVDERVTTYTDRLDGMHKPKKEDKPDKREQDPRYIEDSTYHKETRGDRVPSRDETRVSRVSTDKITVTRTDDIAREEVKRHDHPSEQQVGRIVIDEIPDERITEPKKVKKDKQPEKQRPRHLQVEDVETVHRAYDTKPREDETPRKYISSDKITITKYDITKQEDTERRKHPKDVDIGRIVIEEIPGEKEQGPTKQQEQPRDTQVTITRKEVKDIPKPREETIKVGKLDLRDVEKEVAETRKSEGTLITHTERVDHSRKFVTDQHTVGETRIDVTDERVRMGTGPKDKTFMDVQTAGPCVITDRIDGRQKVDDKTEGKKIVESTLGVDTLRGHEVVMDSVWEESIKPLDQHPDEPEVEKPVLPEAIAITKDDRSKVQEDVRVSLRKVETQEKKEDVKVRRFKIDESRDIHGVKKYKEPVKEKRIKEKPKKETEQKQREEPEEKPRKELEKPKREKQKPLKEKQTQTKERIDERDKKIAYYEKKERERLQRAHEKRRYEEERYQMKRASSDPWMHVRRHEKQPLHEITATQVIHDDPRRYFDDKYETEVRRKPATLPWIEVRRRTETEKDRRLVSQKSRHAYHMTQESSGRDRLLLLKIPQKMSLSMQDGKKSKVQEIDIPWMEIEATPDYGSEALPWIELEAHDPKTGRDRLIMLKIPRDMVLKTSEHSKGSDREIQLRWDDVTRYFEETGQIPLGSAVRMHLKHPPTMSITLPREANNGRYQSTSQRTVQSTSQRTVSHEGLPTIRLMMPKKFYAAGSWQDRPLINFNPDRRIKLRLNQQLNSKTVEDVRTIRLNEYDRRTNYMPVALTRDSPRRVLLADGATWKRLDIDDLRALDQEKGQCNPSRFRNAYEIGQESEAHSFPDLRGFSKEKSGTTRENPKIFSFLINGNKDKK